MSEILTSLTKTEQSIHSLNRYQLNIQGCEAMLDVENFTGREMMSDTYRYRITFTSPVQDIQHQKILRRSATFTFRTLGEKAFGITTPPQIRKIVHGIITDFKRLGSSRDEAQYQITLEPKFALLSRQQRSYRFFLNQSVPEIVESILREHNFKGWEFEFNLKNTYPKREQINQVNESDRDFIERLLSELGIFYTFRLQPDSQTEVIHFGDKQRCYEYGKTLPVNSPSGMNDHGEYAIWALTQRHQVVEHSVQTKDYNYRIAQHILNSAQADVTRGDGENITYGDVTYYKPRHLTVGDKLSPEPETANFWARLDHERFLASQTLLHAKSTDPTLMAGQVLTVEDTALPSTLPEIFQSPILLTQLRFTGSRAEALQVKITAVPFSESLCWRPPLKPRPVISGTLTARITSPIANDLYAHQHQNGQYWVKFDADNDKKKQGYESMPVRLAKPYGGDTYGFHFPLIQGTEVAIAFHEGDPDRPYIAHALHNSYRVDHVTARNHTRNVIRTPANNKLRMEDKRGQEHIKLSTEYGGKSQLNLGHLVNSQNTKRGDGFELRTDSWGAIRAGKGLFISTDLRAGASSEQLDLREACQQLKDALDLTGSLRESAEIAKAELADLKNQKQLLIQSIEELKQAALLMSAPAGIAMTTPKTMQINTGQSLAITTADQTDISAIKRITLAAGKAISLFAREAGMKLFANKGKIEMQAQGDEMHLSALKDLTMSSHAGKTIISAKDELLLMCGSAYIRLKNGEIEYGSPANQIVKASNWSVQGAESMDITHPEFPQSIPKQSMRFQLFGSPLSPTAIRDTEPYELYANGELIQKGLSDKEGNITIEHHASIDSYEIKLPLSCDSYQINIKNAGEEKEENNIAREGFRMINPGIAAENPKQGADWRQKYFSLLRPKTHDNNE
ncbi:type VI secretion system tip protein VgrG [Xenorhabdus sp. M]|uniref:Type VI secretion system tip protein VgrG n=1 Tax=Xenorhabdus szentirmaii TaxID=290112 RepID=A0AAW3YY29_9GAMM|nr:type VI secretion system tip protein VgrG [Xenorhabdus sp. M]MBD2801073.1 type VI secretion system tip protein VgrG [Xenorhabdus sp. M]